MRNMTKISKTICTAAVAGAVAFLSCDASAQRIVGADERMIEVFENYSKVIRIRNDGYISILDDVDSSVAISCWERQIALSSRLAIMFSDLPPPASSDARDVHGMPFSIAPPTSEYVFSFKYNTAGHVADGLGLRTDQITGMADGLGVTESDINVMIAQNVTDGNFGEPGDSYGWEVDFRNWDDTDSMKFHDPFAGLALRDVEGTAWIYTSGHSYAGALANTINTYLGGTDGLQMNPPFGTFGNADETPAHPAASQPPAPDEMLSQVTQEYDEEAGPNENIFAKGILYNLMEGKLFHPTGVDPSTTPPTPIVGTVMGYIRFIEQLFSIPGRSTGFNRNIYYNLIEPVIPVGTLAYQDFLKAVLHREKIGGDDSMSLDLANRIANMMGDKDVHGSMEHLEQDGVRSVQGGPHGDGPNLAAFHERLQDVWNKRGAIFDALNREGGLVDAYVQTWLIGPRPSGSSMDFGFFGFEGGIFQEYNSMTALPWGELEGSAESIRENINPQLISAAFPSALNPVFEDCDTLMLFWDGTRGPFDDVRVGASAKSYGVTPGRNYYTYNELVNGSMPASPEVEARLFSTDNYLALREARKDKNTALKGPDTLANPNPGAAESWQPRVWFVAAPTSQSDIIRRMGLVQ